MEHLNYCRQIAKQTAELLKAPNLVRSMEPRLQLLIKYCTTSQKFMLPDGGWAIDDLDFRGLDADLPLKLPHQLIALEFKINAENSDKVVLFVEHHEETNCLRVTPACFFRDVGFWDWYQYAEIPVCGYLLDRFKTGDGKPRLNFSCPNIGAEISYGAFVSVVLAFLNALACLNVGIERSPARKQSSKKSGKALPFDDYHILVIRQPKSTTKGQGKTNRSPREHVRRGHIRRLLDGKRIWVNQTLVGAGRAAGVIKKDYLLRSAA